MEQQAEMSVYNSFVIGGDYMLMFNDEVTTLTTIEVIISYKWHISCSFVWWWQNDANKTHATYHQILTAQQAQAYCKQCLHTKLTNKDRHNCERSYKLQLHWSQQTIDPVYFLVVTKHHAVPDEKVERFDSYMPVFPLNT